MKTIKTICQSLAGLAASAVLALGVAESAVAFTLIFDESDANVVTGIEDLEIDGTKYDIEFIKGSFNEVFGNVGDLTVLEDETPFFWGNREDAEAVGNAIAGALGTTFFTGRHGETGRQHDSFAVPFDGIASPSYPLGIVSDYQGLAAFERVIASGVNEEESFIYARVVTPEGEGSVQVSEPASTIAILAVAGTGLLATRKRKK